MLVSVEIHGSSNNTPGTTGPSNGPVRLLREPASSCSIVVDKTENASHLEGQDTASLRRARWRYRLALMSILMAGIAVGIVHHMIGLRSLFVFRNAEPLSSWMIILGGPLTTLPAVLMGLFRRSWGAIWLIAGGLFSLSVVIVTEATSGERIAEIAAAAFRFSVMFTIPMVTIGMALWLFPSRD